VFAKLLHHHRVGAGRDRRAGENPGGRSRLQRRADAAGLDTLRHRQTRRHAANIGNGDGIAVHGRIVERRRIDRRPLRLRQHAPGGGQRRQELVSETAQAAASSCDSA
jgi:hypothetical protein